MNRALALLLAFTGSVNAQKFGPSTLATVKMGEFNMCLDTGDAGVLKKWPCNGSSPQQFILDEVDRLLKSGGKCVDSFSLPPTEGSPAPYMNGSCDVSNTNMQWEYIEGTGELMVVSKADGGGGADGRSWCLDDKGDLSQGSFMKLMPCSGNISCDGEGEPACNVHMKFDLVFIAPTEAPLEVWEDPNVEYDTCTFSAQVGGFDGTLSKFDDEGNTLTINAQDFSNYDSEHSEFTGIDTFEGCQTLCDDLLPYCKSFLYNPVTQKCSLRDKDQTSTSDSNNNKVTHWLKGCSSPDCQFEEAWANGEHVRDEFKGGQVGYFTDIDIYRCQRECASNANCRSFSFGDVDNQAICDLRDRDHNWSGNRGNNYGGDCDNSATDLFGEDTRYCEPNTGGFVTWRKTGCATGNGGPRTCSETGNVGDLNLGIGNTQRIDGEGNLVSSYSGKTVEECKTLCESNTNWNSVSFTHHTFTNDCYCFDKEVNLDGSQFQRWVSGYLDNKETCQATDDQIANVRSDQLLSTGLTKSDVLSAVSATKDPPLSVSSGEIYQLQKAKAVLEASRIVLENGRRCETITDRNECCSAQSPELTSYSSKEGYNRVHWDCFASAVGTTFSDGSVCKSEKDLMDNSLDMGGLAPFTDGPSGLHDMFSILTDVEDASLATCWGIPGAKYRGLSSYSLLGETDYRNTAGGLYTPGDGGHPGAQVLGSHDAATGYSTTEFYGLGDTGAFFSLGNVDFLPTDYGVDKLFPRRCHSIDIVAQLNCGVRFFDFRPYEAEDGQIYFHHAYDIVREDDSVTPVTLGESLDEIQEWSRDHPTELVTFWVNNCATGKTYTRFEVCNKLGISDQGSCGGLVQSTLSKEGSDYCFKSFKEIKDRNIPIIAGCQGNLDMSGGARKRYQFQYDSTGAEIPAWADYQNIYEDWSKADYKGLAAGTYNRRLEGVNGTVFGDVSATDGKMVVTQDEYDAAKAGVIVIGPKCMTNNRLWPWTTWDMDLDMQQMLTGGGDDVGEAFGIVYQLKDMPAQKSGWHQAQAFWQQGDMVGANWVAAAYERLSVMQVSRTSRANQALYDAILARYGGNKWEPSGSGGIQGKNYNAISINDVCYYGSEMATALGTKVTDRDLRQCRLACAQADLRAPAVEKCPFMYEGESGLDNWDQQGWCNAASTGPYNKCEFAADSRSLADKLTSRGNGYTWGSTANQCNLVENPAKLFIEPIFIPGAVKSLHMQSSGMCLKTDSSGDFKMAPCVTTGTTSEQDFTLDRVSGLFKNNLHNKCLDSNNLNSDSSAYMNSCDWFNPHQRWNYIEETLELMVDIETDNGGGFNGKKWCLDSRELTATDSTLIMSPCSTPTNGNRRALSTTPTSMQFRFESEFLTATPTVAPTDAPTDAPTVVVADPIDPSDGGGPPLTQVTDQIQSRHMEGLNRCLDIDPNDANYQLKTYSCSDDGNVNQQFTFDVTTGSLKNNGLCLDSHDVAVADSRPYSSSCESQSTNTNRQWTLIQSTGEFMVATKKPNGGGADGESWCLDDNNDDNGNVGLRMRACRLPSDLCVPFVTDCNPHMEWRFRTQPVGTLATVGNTEAPSNAPTSAPTTHVDLKDPDDYVSVKIEQGVVTYDNNADGNFNFVNYNFDAEILAGSLAGVTEKHLSPDGWTRQVRFGRCKSAQELAENVPDNCDITAVSFDDFDAEDNKFALSQTLDWIQTKTACEDITWNDGAGSDEAVLSWWVSYNVVKNSGVFDGVYDHQCIEHEYKVEFSNNLQASASFSGVPKLADTIDEVRVLSVDMESCGKNAGGYDTYKLNYRVLMTMNTPDIDGDVFVTDNGFQGYMPYAVKPVDATCHYDETTPSAYLTNRVTKLTDTAYEFAVSTDCRRIDEDTCDAFQKCDGNENSGIGNYGLSVQFKRGNDVNAIRGNIDVSIKHQECVGPKDFERQTIAGVVDVWRVSNTNTDGFERVYINGAQSVTVSQDERIFAVMHVVTNVYDSVEGTTLVDGSGYSEVAYPLCTQCSESGCYPDSSSAVGTFGAFAHGEYNGFDQEYVWREIIPDGNPVVTFKFNSTLRNGCPAGRRLRSSDSRSLQSTDVTAKFESVEVVLTVHNTQSVVYDKNYTDVISSESERSQFLVQCQLGFATRNVAVQCSDVFADADGRVVVKFSGEKQDLLKAVVELMSSASPLQAEGLTADKVTSLAYSAADSEDIAKTVNDLNEHLDTADLSDRDIIAIVFGSVTVVSFCMVFLFCTCRKSGYSRLQ